jgi:hypothetical protein
VLVGAPPAVPSALTRLAELEVVYHSLQFLRRSLFRGDVRHGAVHLCAQGSTALTARIPQPLAPLAAALKEDLQRGSAAGPPWSDWCLQLRVLVLGRLRLVSV